MSKLTREDFEKLAETIAPFKNEMDGEVWDSLVLQLSDFCKRLNETFNHSEFRRACLRHYKEFEKRTEEELRRGGYKDE